MIRIGRLAAALLIVGALGLVVSATAEESAAEKVFKKLLYDRVGAEWYARMQNHVDDVVLGTVHVSVSLTRDGTIHDLRVTSNTANAPAAEVALDSIRHAKIPAPPTELLKHGRFEIGLSFKVFPNST
jgi:hypothetical protein